MGRTSGLREGSRLVVCRHYRLEETFDVYRVAVYCKSESELTDAIRVLESEREHAVTRERLQGLVVHYKLRPMAFGLPITLNLVAIEDWVKVMLPTYKTRVSPMVHKYDDEARTAAYELRIDRLVAEIQGRMDENKTTFIETARTFIPPVRERDDFDFDE